MEEIVLGAEMITGEIRYVIPRGFARRSVLAGLSVSSGDPSSLIVFGVFGGGFIVLGALGLLPFGNSWWPVVAGVVGFYFFLLIMTFISRMRLTSMLLPVAYIRSRLSPRVPPRRTRTRTTKQSWDF